MSNNYRGLSEAFENDLRTGRLAPLLKVVHRDRDLILEIRDECATVYCKGQRLATITPHASGYEIRADEAFWTVKRDILSSEGDSTAFVREQLPFIKQAIAEYGRGPGGGLSSKVGGLEIEFEQFLIRANNNEPSLNTDYFAVDRQGVLGGGLDRMDVIGVHWPRTARRNAKDVALALIEVKFSLSGGVEAIADQVAGYYSALVSNIETIAGGVERLLRQKLRLGLITGGSEEALRKLETLPVSTDVKRVKIALALVDYNPHSTLLRLSDIGKLPFADQVEVFHLGLGMWSGNAQRVPVALEEPV